MKKLGRILHGVYTILATYLLGWVVYFAVVSLGFHVATEWAVGHFGFGRPVVWWNHVGAKLGLSSLTLRFLVYTGLHALLLIVGWEAIRSVKRSVERGFDAALRRFYEATRERRGLRTFARGVFTVVVTAVLVPFVLQPTLVGDWRSSHSWYRRAANLADGTASRYIVDSVVGEYRKWFAGPVESVGGVDSKDLDEPEPPDDDGDSVDGPPAPSGDRPMMDRWDGTLRQIADGDPETFARLKAFMWVESGGRQFAVSHTGCAGLMQFCSGTARSQPFRSVFGTGAVYTCSCDGRCHTPDDVVSTLETGDGRPASVADEFPCELSDARFDAEKSIRAGKLYIDRLARKFGGNLYLMYIGYNSGPAVAARVWRRIGRDAGADLAAIEPHLADAMRPHFPDSASTRARSLLQTHLPKLKRAHDRYLRQGQQQFALHARDGEMSRTQGPAHSPGPLPGFVH